jgi:hypothetical protein
VVPAAVSRPDAAPQAAYAAITSRLREVVDGMWKADAASETPSIS